MITAGCSTQKSQCDCCLLAEAAHQRGATDQAESMARDLENTRAELAAAKLNLDKARSDQGKVNAANRAS